MGDKKVNLASERQMLYTQAGRLRALMELGAPDVLIAAELRLFQTEIGGWFYKTISRLIGKIDDLRKAT